MFLPEGIREVERACILKGRGPGSVSVTPIVPDDLEAEFLEVPGDLDTVFQEPAFLREPSSIPKHNGQSKVGFSQTLAFAPIVEAYDNPPAAALVKQRAPLRIAQVERIRRIAILGTLAVPFRKADAKCIEEIAESSGVTSKN